MKVTVALFGEYRKYAPETEFPMELEGEATPMAVVEKLKIPLSPSLWVLVDGKRSVLDEKLHEGSKIFFFQPVGGG